MFHLDLKDRVARIGIDRGAARNAIPIDAWRDLTALLAHVGESDARVLILQSGMEGVFSAGADIGDLAPLAEDIEGRGRFRQEMGEAIEALAALPIATIALIEGGCFGAAVAVAMACDMRIAGPAARFAITPAKLGIGYPPTDVARLKALVGPGQAARLLFSAATVDAAEALAIGLIEERDDNPAARVAALAAVIAANAPSSITILKRSLAGDRGAAAAFEGSFGSADFAEGVAAFQTRRAPEFGV
ncbi:enoyl-CoA hydratase/isomerase family protein [Sphingomonas crocodyli]|uniref:Enoyl-CoA hydratase/isomerase family protein n=1 Tax=Sphingomonas crocodyli TaxID=1979270 RepID=A0A437MB98_9SPHN|nr:enoyl-CoA hydratase/isomerase family protein [Sphingomonas crocodyli]RVT94833.1 enoyl-CoA hydratase/isomerase family protein [Sphingomonas crocodyli]